MTWSYNYITAAVWTAGFHWWRFGNKKQMQNVSQYMLVLALFLVNLFRWTFRGFRAKEDRTSYKF